MAAAALFGAREDAVAHAERIPSPILHHPYTRRRGARLPALGPCPDGIALDRRDAEHGYARQPTILVECRTRSHFDQTHVGHVPVHWPCCELKYGIRAGRE